MSKVLSKYVIVGIVVVVVLASVVAYMSLPKTTTPQITHVRFLAGVSGGGGYQFGTTLIKIWQEKIPGVTFTLEATQGFIDNAKKMFAGVGELGVVPADEALKILSNTPPYNTSGYKLYSVFPLLPLTYFHVLVPADSPIKSFSDLNGRRVNILTRGSLTEQLAVQIFNILGISIVPTYLTHTDAAIALSKGEIDAAATTTFASQYKELALTKKLKVLSLTDEEVNKLKKALPYLSFEVFDFGTQYEGCGKALVPISWTLVVARADLPEDFVYRLVKTVYENLGNISATYPAAKELTPELLLKAPLPLHPGVIKYYSERGIKVPDELRPKT
jgi:TRAP transporter TAXI family solute receptor